MTRYPIGWATRDCFEYWFLTMNKKLWDSLSDEDKAILSGAADKVMSDQALAAEKDENEFKQKLIDAGVKVYEVNDQEWQAGAKNGPRQSVAGHPGRAF